MRGFPTASDDRDGAIFWRFGTRRRRWVVAGTAATVVLAVTGALVAVSARRPADAAVATAGTTQSGRATFYSLGAAGMGNCSFPAEVIADTMYVAAGPQDYADAGGCGGSFDVTGPNGRVRVLVADKCPECEPGHLDLSQEAFGRIGQLSAGIIPITYRAVRDPALAGPLGVRVKEGSSQWWIGFLITNHGNPLTSVEYRDSGGTWHGLTRKVYNYWQQDSGAGPGPFTLRITDVYGHTATVDGVRLTPEVTQNTGVMMYGGAAGSAGGAAASPVGHVPTSPVGSVPASPVGSAVTSSAGRGPASAATSPAAGGAGAACSASVSVAAAWNGGFQASVTVRNTSSVPVLGWQAAWAMPAGATVSAGWNADLRQSASAVTAMAPAWNQSLAPGASVSIGFNAVGPAGPVPGGVTLNGAVCSADQSKG